AEILTSSPPAQRRTKGFQICSTEAPVPLALAKTVSRLRDAGRRSGRLHQNGCDSNPAGGSHAVILVSHWATRFLESEAEEERPSRSPVVPLRAGQVPAYAGLAAPRSHRGTLHHPAKCLRRSPEAR